MVTKPSYCAVNHELDLHNLVVTLEPTLTACVYSWSWHYFVLWDSG